MTAKTLAERQRDYRERVVKQGVKCRISFLISKKSKSSLERLALRYTVTQQQILERLIDDFEQQLIKTMPEEEIENYFSANGNADDFHRHRAKKSLEQFRALIEN